MSEALVHMAAAANLGWSLSVGAVGVEAIRRAAARQRAAKRPVRLDAPVTVLLVRPCAGDEPRLLANLRSLVAASRSFALRCRLAVADESDGALAAARRATWWLRAYGIDAQVVITGARGANRKASQLSRVIAQEREPFDVVMVADSDVDLVGADLDRLVAPLIGAQRAGATWAPPAELGRALTLGDRAAAALLGASLHAFPLLAGLDRAGFVGKLFAVRSDALERVGGFGALTEHLGEDMELARRLLAHGDAVEAAPLVARAMPEGRSLSSIVERFGRWLMVIRAQRPWLLVSYPLLFFATPLIALVALATVLVAPALSASAALVALVSRAAVARAAAHAAGRRARLVDALVDAVVADLLLAAAFARALSTRTVVWRNVALTIDRAGLLRERAM